jgi:hypothetical protein
VGGGRLFGKYKKNSARERIKIYCVCRRERNSVAKDDTVDDIEHGAAADAYNLERCVLLVFVQL